uniref:Uncharacterized protein n=1 Tax=Opuntia streptacantha TaxID=393608 RepID=A0A7C9DIM6_OPUST
MHILFEYHQLFFSHVLLECAHLIFSCQIINLGLPIICRLQEKLLLMDDFLKSKFCFLSMFYSLCRVQSGNVDLLVDFLDVSVQLFDLLFHETEGFPGLLDLVMQFGFLFLRLEQLSCLAAHFPNILEGWIFGFINIVYCKKNPFIF